MSSTSSISSLSDKLLNNQSNDPSVKKVVESFLTFIDITFRHYVNAEPNLNFYETFEKVATYLSSISDELCTLIRRQHSATKGDINKHQEKKKKNLEIQKKSSNMQKSSESKLWKFNKKSSLFKSISDDNDCRICLDSIEERRYGILEQCDHKYCEPCIRTLVQENLNQPINCPTCRIRFNKVIFRSRFISSGPEKMVEFDSMLCCAVHQSEQNISDVDNNVMTLEDEENDPGIVTIDINDPRDPDFVVDSEESDSDEELTSYSTIDEEDLSHLFTNDESDTTGTTNTVFEYDSNEFYTEFNTDFDIDTEFVVDLSTDTADSSSNDFDSLN